MKEPGLENTPDARRDIIVPGEILDVTFLEALLRGGEPTPELVDRYEAEVRAAKELQKIGPEFYNIWINT